MAYLMWVLPSVPTSYTNAGLRISTSFCNIPANSFIFPAFFCNDVVAFPFTGRVIVVSCSLNGMVMTVNRIIRFFRRIPCNSFCIPYTGPYTQISFISRCCKKVFARPCIEQSVNRNCFILRNFERFRNYSFIGSDTLCRNTCSTNIFIIQVSQSVISSLLQGLFFLVEICNNQPN